MNALVGEEHDGLGSTEPHDPTGMNKRHRDVIRVWKLWEVLTIHALGKLLFQPP